MPQRKLSIACGGESIPFDLIYSNRKQMEIAVHPDGVVVVKAPLGADEDLIMQRVHKRVPWIRRQLRYFEQFQPRAPQRRFVGGESHLYLGRKYRLKIAPGATGGVVLTRGFLRVTSPDEGPERVAQLLGAWYRRRAAVYFPKVLEECWRRHHFDRQGVEKPALKIRGMKTRWGSFSKRGGITLNLELIKAPGECIEYVIVHELCHLLHDNHGREFYNLLERALPDWKKRKHKLEMTLSRAPLGMPS